MAMGSVAVRTAAGDVLSIPTTPADVVDRCPECRRGFREGDWHCDHLAASTGHTIAHLGAAAPPVPADGPHRYDSALMPVFHAPGP